MTSDADWDTTTPPSRAARAERHDSTRPKVAVPARDGNHSFRDSVWAALIASAVILLITALAAFAGSTTM